MSKAMNAISHIVRDTHIKMTSGNYNHEMYEDFTSNVGKANDSLDKLSNRYLLDDNRSGYLRAQVMKIALQEADDMVNSTKNISTSGGIHQIKTEDQSRMFLDSIQKKLENLVTVSEFEDGNTKELKEFMIDAQKIYTEKDTDFQKGIEERINNVIGEHFVNDEVFNVCNELFECTNKCSTQFIGEHLSQEQIATKAPYKEPTQNNSIMREKISTADMGRVRDEFNQHARANGWADSMEAGL